VLFEDPNDQAKIGRLVTSQAELTLSSQLQNSMSIIEKAVRQYWLCGRFSGLLVGEPESGDFL